MWWVALCLFVSACGAEADSAVSVAPSTVTPLASPSSTLPSSTTTLGQVSASGAASTTPSTTSDVAPWCPPPGPAPTGDGLRRAYVGELTDWRTDVIAVGGGFAALRLIAAAEIDGTPGFDVEVGDVLWDAPSELNRQISWVSFLGVDSSSGIDVAPDLDVVALLSNNGVVWSIAAIDDRGCLQAVPVPDHLDMTNAARELVMGWEHHLAWPAATTCDVPTAPPQPDADVDVIAEFLARIGDITDERHRLNDLDRRADQLSHQLGADINDVKRQLLAGVPEDELELRPLRQLTLRIPSIEKDTGSLLVLMEGQPLQLLGWLHADPRISVELLMPRPGNTVNAYLLEFDDLADLGGSFDCGEILEDIQPYAVIPAEAFLEAEKRLNIDKWRP